MSSPLRPGADIPDQLAWYKAQYAQLEADLAEFQASSKELEEQLETDVETAEKNERKWKEQVEKLNFEVEEWKTKHRQAKTEANSAQNVLQKEITTMRESNRALQLKLRDTEVMNDDYERQARNTETSLEDLESKYNATIERGVLFEETIRQGEQEREGLRIETQRLRDDLGDLKVENEITLEKLRLAEETIEGLRARKSAPPLAVEGLRARSPGSEASGMTPLSPTASTPPPKSDAASDAITPPSPPLSDAPTTGKMEHRTPLLAKRRSLIPDTATPRPLAHGTRAAPKYSRGTSVASSISTNTATSDMRPLKAPSRTRPISRLNNAPEQLPRSESLYQIRGLIGRMQKIEERVQNARSKLPPPGSTPRNSPRTGSALSENIPSSVTVRRASRRPSISRTSSMAEEDSSMIEGTPLPAEATTRRGSHIKRLSYGIPRPISQATSRSDMPERPPSALDRPPSAAAQSRPRSRASMASQGNRPPSRSGARTELGHYPGSAALTATSGSRTSLGGSHTSLGHRTSASVSELRRKAESDDLQSLSTPNRRTTLERSGLPTPSALPAPSAFSKSTSSGLRQSRATGSRTSNNFSQVREEGDDGSGAMRPPPLRRKMSEVGETW